MRARRAVRFTALRCAARRTLDRGVHQPAVDDLASDFHRRVGHVRQYSAMIELELRVDHGCCPPQIVESRDGRR
jgi:hypothetical protein